MIGKIKKLIELDVHPDLLRRWADLCKRQWDEARAGDDTTFLRIPLNADTDLALRFDQETMHRQVVK